MLLRRFVFFPILLVWVLGLTAPARCIAAAGPITVYVFLNTECPISQQYARRLTTLHRQYDRAAVRFVALFPLRTDSPGLIRHFCATYHLSLEARPDPGARLAHQFRTAVTPEVVVVDPGGRIRYQGAIDDWYVALGKHRPDATQPYLRDALDAVLAGKAVALPRTEAVGCLIE
ncbi:MULTISPECIES: thioredoxin domain-containing protein [Spirosoma]|uniref:Redoxin domain-containing protein n=1 Tax=Spirosoma sordidisoli TaxID=2502893 RepID=A0A4Q2UIR7_9BACT|nr:MULTISPECIES: redoxin domain-containing protein [Spirosoma]RYC69016.1 redoxin domain-containing protein [Spirosoma sordidisoli]